MTCLFRSKGQIKGKLYFVPLIVVLLEDVTFVVWLLKYIFILVIHSDASLLFTQLVVFFVSVNTSLVALFDELRAVAIFESLLG